MQMMHTLPSPLAAVGDDAEIGQPKFLRHLGDDFKNVSDYGRIFRGNLSAGADVGFGNH